MFIVLALSNMEA